MRAKNRMWIGTIIAATLVASALSGCASASTSPAKLSGVVGTGTLHPSGSGPAISGRFQIVAEPASQSFVVRLIDFTGEPGSEVDLNLNSKPIAPNATCEPTGIAFDLGPVSSKPNQSFVLHGAQPGLVGLENPSFLVDATLTHMPLSSASHCTNYVLAAYAPLHWSIGDIRPDIHVADGGSQSGAGGKVTLAAGRPLSYTVAAGDNLSSIAKRFHITVDDIFYLNPARAPSPDDPNVTTGEVLNLSKAHR